MILAPPAQLRLVAGRSHRGLAESVSALLDTPLTPVKIEEFASGETQVRIEENVRGSDVFLLQSFGRPVATTIVETLLIVDALKRAACRSVTLVCPYFPYARQDKQGNHREPISARVIADAFAGAGVDALMSVDLHTEQLSGFFRGSFDHLHALELLASEVEKRWGSEALTVVSPDAGRVKQADRWGDRLGAPLAILHKKRSDEVMNQVEVLELVGEVEGRTCILVDDMIDTAGTIVAAADALLERGAQRVIVAATHGVLSDPAHERLAASGIEQVVLIDTLPVEAGSSEKIHVVSCAELLARAIHAAFTGGSVHGLGG